MTPVGMKRRGRVRPGPVGTTADAAPPGVAGQTPAAAGYPTAANPGPLVDRRLLAAGGLAAAWLLPMAAHALKADWVTLAAVVLGTAASLRGATGLLDRLVVATALLAGALCAATLALSRWPWHLHPVALGGLALTTLVGIAALPGHRPRLPAPRRRDAAVLVPSAVFALGAAWPFLGRSIEDRLALVIRGEDLARHFAMYDTIRRVGGYLFLHREAAGTSVIANDLSYPTGAHLIAAVVDNFLTSSASVGDSVEALRRFLWYDLAAFGFLCLAVLWAARRIAGPAVSVWAFAPVAGATVGYLLFGEVLTAFLYGFAPQILGLGLLAILVGLLARPLASTREQVLAAVALVVAIGFTYYLLLPVAAIAGLVYAHANRRRLRRRRLFAAAVTVPGAALAAVPRIVNSADHPTDILLQDFGIVRVERPPVLVLTLLVFAAGWLGRGWWRSPAMRVAGAAAGAMLAFTVALGAAQLYSTGHTAYFFNKALHGVIVLLLVALGGAAPLLAPVAREVRWRRPGAVAAALLLAAATPAALGAFEHGPRVVGGVHPTPAGRVSWGRLHVVGALASTGPAHLALRVYRRVPDGAGKWTLISTGSPGDHLATIYAAVLQRDFGPMWPTYLWMIHHWPDRDAATLGKHLLANPRPGIQLISNDPALLDGARRLGAAHPEIPFDVVDARALPGP